MPNLIRTTANIEPRDSGAFKAIDNHIYPNVGTYILHPTGIYRSVVSNAIWPGYQNGDWTIYQTSPSLTLDDTSIGSFVEFDSRKSLERNGSKYVKPNAVYTKKDQPYLYEYYSLTRPELIIDENKFRTPTIYNYPHPTYDIDQIYNKGDILYIEPGSYDEQTFAIGTYVTHLGKSITYQAETKVKRYSIVVRSTKDNNTDNPITYLGTSWILYQPNDIIEEGTSSLGKYVVYANNVAKLYCTKTLSGLTTASATDNEVTYPIKATSIIDVSPPYVNVSGYLFYQHVDITRNHFYVPELTKIKHRYSSSNASWNASPAILKFTMEISWY